MSRSRFRAPILPLALSAALAVGCGGDSPERPSGEAGVRELDSPAGAASGEPFLATDDEGRVHMSWLEPDSGGSHALRFATLEGGTWSEPRTIVRRDDLFVNWADFPSLIALPGGRLVVHWLQRSGGGTYAYDVRLAHSADGGERWSESLVPHSDGTKTEHGFVSLFPEADGAVGAVWLDGRQYAETGSHGDGEMTLRYGRVLPSAGGHGWQGVRDEALLDARTCDCCQTSVALARGGPVVAYRDRSADEIRDIWVVRRTGKGWSEPAPVHADGWEIPACPVNGPSAAARGDRVAVAWFTAAQNSPRVNLAFSADGGAVFREPVRVDTGSPEGRVDLTLLEDGSAMVLWLERTEGGAEVRLRRVAADGGLGPVRVIGASSAARASGFPRMVAADGRMVFAWTEPGDPGRIRVAAAPLEAL